MRTRQALAGVVAAALLTVLLAGVPLLLVAGLGNPLPDWSALGAGNLSDTMLLQLLGCVVWLAWAQWVPGTLIEIVAGVRDARTRRAPQAYRLARESRHISAGQGLSRALVTAIVGLAIAAPIAVNAGRAWAASPPAPSAVTAPAVHSASGAHSGDALSGGATTATQQVADRSVEHPVFVVGSNPAIGPSLWSIAEHTMGDPMRWHDIWALNKNQSMGDGAVFSTADEIRDGWRLRLPVDATVPAPTAPGTEVIVQAGDTVDEIAHKHHVDPQRLIDANLGRSEPGGRIFDEPNLVVPDWQLRLPVAAGSGTAPHPSYPRTAPGHSRPSGRTGPTRQAPPSEPPPHEPTRTPTQTPTQTPTREPAPAAPAHATAGQGHEDANGRVPASSSTRHPSDLPMVAFVGGGMLLAGASLTTLIACRRRQFRHRHPGNTISASPPGLLRAERTLLSIGGPAILDVTWLDKVLRGLVHGMDDGGDSSSLVSRLPDVVAARLSRDELELVLATAQPAAPTPWRVDESGRRWSIPRGEECDYDPGQRAYHFAPFPTLTSVGYGADGSQWLLDLERVASMSLAGDPERCLNLARFLACELAHNTWSEMLQVTLVGFGQELVEANPDRLSYTANFDSAIADLAEQVDSVTDALQHGQLGVLAARIGTGGDVWAPHVLFVAPTAAQDREGLDRLLATMRSRRSRMAVAVVLIGEPEHADVTTWKLTVDSDGTLHIPGLGIDVTAQQMPPEDAAEIARLLALAATPADAPMPPATGEQPWEPFADAAGALRPPPLDKVNDAPTHAADGATVTAPDNDDDRECASGWHVPDMPALRLADASPRMASSSVLPLPQATYLERAATTPEDLAALAPQTNDAIRETVESTVGELDADLAEWYDERSVRPRVSLLGPVRVRAQGLLPPRNPRTQWHTEIVAYLATRPSGVSSEEYGTALWPNDPDINGKSKVRQSAMIVRKWLGKNPATEMDYLPPALAPGYASYRIEGALVDAELFRRLRLRGLARGTQGTEDLWAALNLVTGEPFSERRNEGYAWLADMPLHHIYAAMIVDVAHTLATHHLGAAEPERAAGAAQIALDAGSTEDVPLLDKVAACDARDLRAEADAFVKRILANHDAEIEEDLPPRTAQILMRRQWIGNAS